MSILNILSNLSSCSRSLVSLALRVSSFWSGPRLWAPELACCPSDAPQACQSLGRQAVLSQCLILTDDILVVQGGQLVEDSPVHNVSPGQHLRWRYRLHPSPLAGTHCQEGPLAPAQGPGHVKRPQLNCPLMAQQSCLHQHLINQVSPPSTCLIHL